MKILGIVIFALIYCALCDDRILEMKSKRAFYDTPYGQIHYKYGGYIDSRVTDGLAVCYMYTFLFIHGNPRSSDEFTELVHELADRFSSPRKRNASFSYIAMDLLGEGQSDDPLVVKSNSSSGYVSMEQYADFMIEIAGKVFEMGEDGTGTGGFLNGNVTRYVGPSQDQPLPLN